MVIFFFNKLPSAPEPWSWKW